jgi:aspartyl-tRNA(Asn)/glutamyl-tRNA(Gln) amidotransferase subunit C
MSLSTDEVRKIASLARLRFTSEQEALFGGQLARIVDYIDQLAAYAAAAPQVGAAAGRSAPDIPEPCLPRSVFLANAPAEMDGFLLVPEVKGGSEDA